MAVKVISWDWKEQPDLEKLGEIVRSFDGRIADIRPVDTGGDYYAVVLSDAILTPDGAQAEFESLMAVDDD